MNATALAVATTTISEPEAPRRPRTLRSVPPAPARAPTRSGQLVDPDRAPAVRRLECCGYNTCLDIALGAGWRGFSCARCRAYEAMTPRGRYRDCLALLELLAIAKVLAKRRARSRTMTASDARR